MDEKKAKKALATKGKAQLEDEAPAGEIVFGGAASNNDMVNFGGDDDEFIEKERETNIIRKCHYSLFDRCCRSLKALSSLTTISLLCMFSLTFLFSVRFALPATYHQKVYHHHPGSPR